MALSFPLAFNDFMALIGLEEGMFTLQRNDQVSGLGNGQPLNAELASPLWRFDGQTVAMKNDDAEAIAAIFELLEAPGRDFYVANPRKIGPREDKDGVILGSATPTINSVASNNREATIKGFPSGYVLSRGDMVAVSYGPSGSKRRDILRIVTPSATANGAGLTPLIEFSTFIRSGVVANDPVLLAPATMRAKLIPGSYRPVQVGALHQRFTFSAIQKLI